MDVCQRSCAAGPYPPHSFAVPHAVTIFLFFFLNLLVPFEAAITLRGALDTLATKRLNDTIHTNDVAVNAEVFEGMPLRWTAPQESSAARGVFLLLHACGPTCDDWVRLPEEYELLRAVHQRGFFTLAPQSHSSGKGCWTERDPPVVKRALQDFVKARGLEGKPIYGLGISNGGVMLAHLEADHGVRFNGHYYIVSAGGALGDNPGSFAASHHPPAAIVHMVQDPQTPSKTLHAISAALEKSHTQFQMLLAPPKPLTDLLKLESKVGLDRDTLAEVIYTIWDWGFTVQHDGASFIKFGHARTLGQYLRVDPEIGPKLKDRSDALTEELAVLEGAHASTAQHVDSSLDFLLRDRSS